MKKTLITLLAVVGIGIAYYVYASSLGPNYAGTANDVCLPLADCLGSWSNVNNVKVEDGVFSTASPTNIFQVYNQSITEFISLLKTTTSTVFGSGSLTMPTSSSYIVFGSSTDLWGTTWTPADINNSNFGFSIEVGTDYKLTDDLQGTNFGFSIPAGATINGILVESKGYQVISTASTAYIDNVRITVYYTPLGSSVPQFQIKSGNFSILSGRTYINN